jgi:hypothetical protein
MTVNQHDWARDLGTGKYVGWTLAGGATHVDATEKEIEAAVKISTPEAFEKPLHILNDEQAEPEKPKKAEPEPATSQKKSSPTAVSFDEIAKEIASTKEE